MRRLLIVAFFFPPINVVGSVRPAKFAKFLPEFGWEPTVLTIDSFSTRPATMPLEMRAANISRVVYRDPVAFFIHRLRHPAREGTGEGRGTADAKTRLYSIARKIFDINVVRMPDRALPWYLPAVRHGSQLLAQQHFDIILSSSPPPTVNLIASTLARRARVPWVADMRDLWTMNHSFHRSQPWQALEENLERRTLKQASHLLTVSPVLAEKLRTFHGKPSDTITNGFDPDLELPAATLASKLTITYTGSLYTGKQDPSPLFEALRMLREQNKLMPGDLEVNFWGSDLGELNNLIERHRVGDWVHCCGSVPYMESLHRQRESAALLFLDWNDPLEPGVYSLKLMEYLGARRPILAIGSQPVSIANELLTCCRVGRVLSTAEQIQSQLSIWLDEFRRNGTLTYQGDPAEIQEYSYRTLTGRLAQLLDRVVENKP